MDSFSIDRGVWPGSLSWFVVLGGLGWFRTGGEFQRTGRTT